MITLGYHLAFVVPFSQCRLRLCSFLPRPALYEAGLMAALYWESSAAARQLCLLGGGCPFPGKNGGFRENWREWQKGRQTAAIHALNKSSDTNSEEAGRAGGWLYAQSWEHWWISRYIPPLCCKDYAASSEQNDAPFAGILLSSTPLLPEHNSSLSVAGKVAKMQLSQDRDCCLCGAGAGWSFVQPRAAGIAHCTGEHRIWEGVGTYRVSGKNKLLRCLMDEVLSQVVCKHYSWFHSWLKTWDAYSFFSKDSPNK